MQAFCEVFAYCDLLDVVYIGPTYTWERGNLPKTNIHKHLDRGIAPDAKNQECPICFLRMTIFCLRRRLQMM